MSGMSEVQHAIRHDHGRKIHVGMFDTNTSDAGALSGANHHPAEAFWGAASPALAPSLGGSCWPHQQMGSRTGLEMLLF